jgi:hypothetical protein
MWSQEGFQKLRDQLKTCPNCGEKLVSPRVNSILRCPNEKHGGFVIVWSGADRRFYINYLTPDNTRGYSL